MSLTYPEPVCKDCIKKELCTVFGILKGKIMTYCSDYDGPWPRYSQRDDEVTR